MANARRFLVLVACINLLAACGGGGDYIGPTVAPGTLTHVREASGSMCIGGNAVGTFSNGSHVVAGYFEGTATFGRGEAHETSLVTAGEGDVFVARFDIQGNLVWARAAGGAVYDAGLAVATFANGSCVVTGYFGGTATFGAGEANETVLVADGFTDVFVARYGANGDLAWACRGGGERGNGIAALSDGSCVVTGEFYGTAIFGNPAPPSYTLVDTGGGEMFLARYDQGGLVLWARQCDGPQGAEGLAIAALPDDDVVVTGDFHGAVTFGPSTPGETELTAVDSADIFVARYAPTGDLDWARRAGGDDSETGTAVATFEDGSIVVAGSFMDSVMFGPGEPGATTLLATDWSDAFVARYGPDGALAWARRAGGSDVDVARGVATHSDGACIVTGYFAGTMTLGSGEPGETTLTDAGFGDIFLARYGGDGSLYWARHAGGPGGDWAAAVGHFGDGSCVVTGGFSVTCTFGGGTPSEQILTSEGCTDLFVMRYQATGGF